MSAKKSRLICSGCRKIYTQRSNVTIEHLCKKCEKYRLMCYDGAMGSDWSNRWGKK
jgi:transposase-like protein